VIVLDDSRIVDLYLARDEMAVEYSANKYGDRLKKLAYGIVCDRLTAEECESDTYMEAWRRIPPHEPRDYLYAFLARITRHIALNCCRDRDRLKRHAHISELDAELERCIPSPSDIDCLMNESELRKAINGFLASLDTEKRKIFVRRYWYMDSISDISKRMGISQSKVKTTLYRCRNSFREYLKKEGYDL